MRTIETDWAIYQRIKSFALFDGNVQVSVESGRTSENHWTLDYTQAVVVECRCFHFLTQTVGQMVCPSHDVGMAWHQHLTQTRSSQHLCDEVLCRFLNHAESKGGIDVLRKYRDIYRFTLHA